MYQNCADHPSNNLRLNEISYLFLILLQNKEKSIRNSCRSNYGILPNDYFEILNVKFGGRSFALYSNSHSADEIRNLPISIDFCI